MRPNAVMPLRCPKCRSANVMTRKLKGTRSCRRCGYDGPQEEFEEKQKGEGVGKEQKSKVMESAIAERASGCEGAILSERATNSEGAIVSERAMCEESTTASERNGGEHGS